ncbi:hypothetical protein MNBD_PLANCTO03-906, partial [hydrothermal vent metagenome]
MQEIGVGIIGLGFMGRTHIAAYKAAAEAGYACRLVAVCDRNGACLDGSGNASGNLDTGNTAEQLFDPEQVACHADPAKFFADPAVHLVSICTHTDTHVEMALRALEAGKHVLVEKPLALTSTEARRVAEAARRAGTICMPAMCMRFWPAWAWLKRAIDAGQYGKVRSASFHRLGSTPDWTDFYTDVSRSGGALVDLHIHDTDFIAWCFGRPRGVVSAGTTNHLTTIFRYDDIPHVVAEGGWAQDPGFGFTMRFVVCFDEATADFDLGREDQLRLSRDGTAEAV